MISGQLTDGKVAQLLLSPDSDAAYIKTELEKRGIGLAPGSDLARADGDGTKA